MNKEKLGLYLKWGIGLVAAAIISPVIFFAIKGLLGLIVAVVIGLIAIHGAPWFSMVLANWALKERKAEARRNPIETRQVIALDRLKRIQRAQDELSVFASEVRNFGDEVAMLRKSEHPEDAEEVAQQHLQLAQLLELKIQKLKEANDQLQAYNKLTERLNRKWKATQTGLRVKKLSGAAEEAAMDKLLSDEAADEVNTRLNQVFADLDMTFALQLPVKDHLTVPQPLTLDSLPDRAFR